MRNNPQKHRLPPFQKNGIILVNKPAGWTSHDVVAFMRARFNIVKAGHCGTLDPAATGLLVIVIGKFTKLSQKFSGEDKIYGGTILLGTETDSQDMDGNIVKTSDYSYVTEEKLKEAFAAFTGEIMQTPPMVSAVKVDGERLYKLARQGKEVELKPKVLVIDEIEQLEFNPDTMLLTIRVVCSKGTYIRALARDIGLALGSGAHLTALRRTRIGDYTVEQCHTLETFQEWLESLPANNNEQ
jgi:tRNA pseudouridine55 synthase